MKKELHAFVFGRVQGVGFRYYTRVQAVRVGLSGYVRNLSNGSVEVLAQGSEEKLEMFISLLKKGSSFSDVEKISFTKDEITGKFEHISFEIW